MFYSFLLFVATTIFLPNQNEPQFLKIEFSSKGCFGKCPIWKMTIDNEDVAYLFAEKYNNQDGNFRANIDKDKIVELKDLISKLQKINVKEYYNYGPTCGNINEMKIYLKDKIIAIRSMRISGPKEVQNILVAIMEIKEKSTWLPTDPQ